MVAWSSVPRPHVANVETPVRSNLRRRWSDPQPGDTVFAVVALTVLSASIRFVNLGGKSLWVDEAASVIDARAGLGEILDGPLTQEHPPGYYAILHFFIRAFGDSEAIVRVPSAIASVVLGLVLFLTARRVFGSQVAMLAMLFLALSPLDVWYAQEARQPIFASLSVATGLYGLSRIDWPGRVIAFIGILAGLYIDFVVAAGWLAIGAIWLFYWWARDRRQIYEWVAITGLAVAAYIPLQGGAFVAGFQSLIGYEDFWYYRVLGSNPLTSSWMGILGLVFAGSLVVSWVIAVFLRRPSRWFPVLLVALYLLLSAVEPVPRAFSVKKIIVVGWPVVVVATAFLVLMKVGPNLRSRFIATALGVSALAVVAGLIVPKDDWRSAVAYINGVARPGDVAWVSGEPWAHNAYEYYEGTLPVFNIEEPADDQIPLGHVWMLANRRPQDSVPSIPAEAWFRENWVLIDEADFYRLAVVHFEPRS